MKRTHLSIALGLLTGIMAVQVGMEIRIVEIKSKVKDLEDLALDLEDLALIHQATIHNLVETIKIYQTNL